MSDDLKQQREELRRQLEEIDHKLAEEKQQQNVTDMIAVLKQLKGAYFYVLESDYDGTINMDRAWLRSVREYQAPAKFKATYNSVEIYVSAYKGGNVTIEGALKDVLELAKANEFGLLVDRIDNEIYEVEEAITELQTKLNALQEYRKNFVDDNN